MDFANDDILGKPENGFLPRSFALYLAAFYMALFIIRPWEVLFPLLASFHFERICAIVVILGVALTSGFRFRVNIQNAAVVIFLAVTGLSALRAYDPPSAWDSFYMLLTLVACYFVLVSVVRTPYHLVMIVGAYILIMEVYLSKALWEYFLHDRREYTMSVKRLIGIELAFGGPNAVAGSIVLSLPFWLFLWRRRHEIMAGWPLKWKRLVGIGLKSYVILAVLGIFLTNSRTGIINLCVFFFLAGCRPGSTSKTVRNFVAVIVVAALVWIVLPNEQRSRISTIWDTSIDESATASAQGRVEGLVAGLRMFRHFPVLGVGPGCFLGYRISNLDGVPLVAHNLAGQVLGETGIVGALGFVLLVGAALVNVRRVRNIARECPGKTVRVLGDIARACRDVIILAMVDGMSGSTLYRYNWLWLGAFCALAFQFADSLYREHLSACPDGSGNLSAMTETLSLESGECALELQDVSP
jgi:hypothetical protein